MTGLPPTAENFRSEMARHRLNRQAVCDIIGMNRNMLSVYLTGWRPLSWWAAHNIGYGINRSTGLRIFDVEMGLGVVPPTKRTRVDAQTGGTSRDPRNSVRLPVAPRRRRRQTKK